MDFLSVEEYREHIQQRIKELSVICKTPEKKYRTKGGYSPLEKQLALQECLGLEKRLADSYLIGPVPPWFMYQEAKLYQESLVRKERERRTAKRIDEATKKMLEHFKPQSKGV